MANSPSERVIRAAGGVVWREFDGQTQIAVIHRARYDDWTLPKGKLLSGESELAAAVREVGEETGATVAVSRRLPTIAYLVDGAAKSVAFWTMRHIAGEFAPSREVDALEWLSVKHARDRVSHDVYRDVLDSFTALPVPYAVIVLARHARAGKRSGWPGDDRDRPLDLAGRRQARKLATFLSYFAPDRILSADRARCVQTVEPAAQQAGIPVEVSSTFSDESFVDDPTGTTRELLALAKPGTTTVVVSQGTAIPGLLCGLPIDPPPSDVTTHKGAAWVLCFADPAGLVADHYDAAPR